MLLLEHDIRKKKQVINTEKQLKFDIRNNKRYKVEAIQDSMAFAKEL